MQKKRKRFVEETGIDLLAPSIGSVHGLIKSGKPHIDTERAKAIHQACGILSCFTAVQVCGMKIS